MILYVHAIDYVQLSAVSYSCLYVDQNILYWFSVEESYLQNI